MSSMVNVSFLEALTYRYVLHLLGFQNEMCHEALLQAIYLQRKLQPFVSFLIMRDIICYKVLHLLKFKLLLSPHAPETKWTYIVYGY